MKLAVHFLCVLCGLCGLAVSGFTLDREAFTFTNYDLTVRIEPEQQRLAARGKITLRNDSSLPQKNVALQISSSLGWRSIQFEGKPVQFVSQPYASDIDHTGALSEAIVTLPREIPPKGSIDLEIGYEGVIVLDATRLTRIGMPENEAKHSDWDQISPRFTAVRGVGYVAWYPVAMESANLSEGNSLEEAVGRWKLRHSGTSMSVLFESTADMPIFFSGTRNLFAVNADSNIAKIADFGVIKFGLNTPTFVTGNYQSKSKDAITVQFLPGQEDGAEAYAEAAVQSDPIPPVGRGSGNLQILGLPDREAASFVSEGMLLCPIKSPITNDAVLNIVYAKARHLVLSPRPWIQEGLAHYAQALFVEQNSGRQAALDYLEGHRRLLVDGENAASGSADQPSETTHSLVNAADDLYLQTKAMYVWWMLRDMLGGTRDALVNYSSGEDDDPSYMQRLLEKQSHRDLQWFFDDWVYHDRGLPDFRIDSVYLRPDEKGPQLVTITVENLGNAGAEVPVTLRTQEGEVTKRLEVRAKSKATIRIEATSKPEEVIVNDGTVPESDRSNDTKLIR